MTEKSLVSIVAILFIMVIVSGCNSSGTDKQSKDEIYSCEQIQLSTDSNEEYKMDHSYVLDVILPGDYDAKESYPVVYITDGNWRRQDIDGITDLYRENKIGEVIYVLICYPDETNIELQRAEEFINYPNETLSILINKIIPAVEDKYSIDKEDRMIFGASCGGYYATYILLHSGSSASGVFKNFGIVSPTFRYDTDGSTLFDFEKQMHKDTDTVDANVFMTVGELESEYYFVDPFNQMVEILNNRKYSGLSVHSEIVEGKDHYSVGSPTLIESLKYFYGI